MASRSSKPKQLKRVETLNHNEAIRKNVLTVEYQSVMAEDEKTRALVAYEQ